MATHNYRELKIWQKSRILVKDVYQITSTFPKEEIYGITFTNVNHQVKKSDV